MISQRLSCGHLPWVHGIPQQQFVLPGSLKTLTFNVLGCHRIFMHSRGIVSAKSEIPGNRHHWVIAMPSHSAGSSSISSWSIKVVVGERADATVGIPHKIEIDLGSRLEMTWWLLYALSLCPLSLHFHMQILNQMIMGNISLCEFSSWLSCDTQGLIFKLASQGNFFDNWD